MVIFAEILFFAFFCLPFCLCVSNSDELETFVKLNDVYHQWLQVSSVPDAAHLTRYPPYSYHLKSLAYDPISVAEITELNGNQTQFLYSDPEDDKCSEDLVQILYNLKSEWALNMIDSYGKLASGVLLGGLVWPGKHRECISVDAPVDENNRGGFHGQYCVASWNVSLGKNRSLSISTGVCVPDSCKGENIMQAGKNVLHILNHLPVLNKVSSALHLRSVICQNNKLKFDNSAVAYMCVLSLFIILVLIGTGITGYEYFSKLYAKEDAVSIHTVTDNNYISSCVPVLHSEHISDLNTDNTDCKKTELENKETSFDTGNSASEHIININGINTDSKKTEPKEDVTSSDNDNSICVSSKIALVDQDIHKESKIKNNCGAYAKKFFSCFSAFENGKKILNIEASSGQLLSLHGIRFLSLTWVIIGHTYISGVAMISNKTEAVKDIDSLFFQMLIQAPFSVDSFFLLSGFLLTYIFFKEANNKNGKINWLYFYAHRLWRLTPVYMLVVGFYMLIFKYLGSGPFWDENYGDSCRHTWWKYLLYINNFIPVHEMCIGWSWYLANDMQFYIISPLFLYVLWRWPKAGLSWPKAGKALLLGSWVSLGVLSAKQDLIPMFVGVSKVKNFDDYQKKMWNTFDIIYDKPYCRIGPYLIGCILGYVLYNVGIRRNFLTWWQQLLGWSIAAFCSLSVVFGLYHVEIGRLTGIFYNALSRSSFSIGLAWLIFACESGHGGFIYKFLSLKFWIPLSRLTYCAYLVHPILIHGYYQGLQTALYFTHLNTVINFMGFLVISFCLAFIVSVVFESPMMNIEKLLLSRNQKISEIKK